MISGFLESAINLVQNIFLPLGGFGVFLATFFAQVIPPISTPVVVFASGFLFLPENVSMFFFQKLIFTLALPAALGVTIGSLFIYYLGFFLGKPLLDKWGRFLNLSWNDVEKLEKKFENSFWDELVLFGLRVFPIVPTFSISLTCGLIRFNIYSYLFFTFFGTFVKVLMLAPLGWQANAFYHKYAFLISGIEKIGLFVVVVAIAVFIFRRISRNKNIAEKGKPQ